MNYKKLQKIQLELKAPKNLYNSFGKYNYRNAESICEAVKPLLNKYETVLLLSDEIIQVGDRYYIKATATIIDIEDGTEKQVSAFARESLDKKGMDDSQITGTASSYARKYALNGMFLLDDTKDADSDEYHEQTNQSSKPKREKEVSIITDEMYKELSELCVKAERTEEYIAKSMGVSDLRSLPLEKYSTTKTGLMKLISNNATNNTSKEKAGA